MQEKFVTPAHGSTVDRSEIPNEFKWQVDDIYPTEQAWLQACDSFKKQLPELTALKGNLNTAARLLKALKLQDEMIIEIDKIYAYARLQQDADSTDPYTQTISGDAEGLSAQFSNANSFIEPEMMALGEAKLQAFFQEEPGLEEFRFYIENFLRLSQHVLSTEQEELYAKGHLALCSSANTFNSLTNADMQFPAITDGQGKPATVSNGNYMFNLASHDRELRKNSFLALHGTYHNFRNTLASTLTGSARTAYYYATTHNYPDTLTSSLAEDNIPVSLYDDLIKTVEDNLQPLHDYVQFKKDMLGYEELHQYDLYVSLNNADSSFACSFPEACAKVEAALAPLGKEYTEVLHRGFTEGWIDVYENKGKRPGAYSWGIYGVHPYVLLNYQERYFSISTIAHELGHSLHSYFSSLNQKHVNSEYTLFCAEVASTTNENLLLEYTLQQANKEQKIFLLTQFLEQVRTTVYRQVQFAEFEKFIHSEITAGRSLQAEKLEQYWLDSNARYYGPALALDPELGSEWSRIPHFYSPFYVYKYATGYSAAMAFASSILNQEPQAVEKYLGFLKAGGSDYSLNILKKAGVDLTTPKPVTVTLNRFAAKLKELKQLLGK